MSRMLRLWLVFFSLNFLYLCGSEGPFFQASSEKPYHISVGAVLFNDEGKVACHHFKDIFGQSDIYILMRESMEDNETLLDTLKRGLMEEFGATATPIAFLGCLSGYLINPDYAFEKTTLYIACKVNQWDPDLRDLADPEAISHIEWHEPGHLIQWMKNQGQLFKRVDADESEMIKRALGYIKQINSH